MSDANGSHIHPHISIGVATSASRQDGRKMGADKLLGVTVAALQFLTRAANDHSKVSYEDVSLACGINNAQWGNISFGAISEIIRLLEGDPTFPYRPIPDLTTIVAHKGKESAGRGVLTSYPLIENKSPKERKQILLRERDRAFKWEHWSELAAFLNITPMPILVPPKQELIDFEKSSRGSAGKSAEHQRMQDQIRENPHIVGIAFRGQLLANHSKCEYLFWSLDRLDVITKTTDEWVGFEVKPISASELEIRKGIYQAVKYRALIRADLLDSGEVKRSRCLLVIQGFLSIELRQLAQRLKVRVIEGFLVS